MSAQRENLSRRGWIEGCAGVAALVSSDGVFAAARDAGVQVELPFRHIHLDFHTSPAVTGVGTQFKAEEFARTLKDAAVNSITVFAKCHHGMSYYPTKVGVRHPNLRIDLLGEMIEACHRAGILVPVYISTMYDQHVWREHSDWRVLDADGKLEGHGGGAGPLRPVLGKVCVNTGYMDYVTAQAEEVLKGYEVDGLFYDNFGYGSACYGASCMAEREKLGFDSANPVDCRKHTRLIMRRSMERWAALVRAHRPKARIFINGPLHLRQDPEFLRAVTPNYTHVEIESLPGGPWGYSYYEMASRYLRGLGPDMMGMTGSFHRSWGDFGTVRNQAALDYECFGMLAQGAKCAIGDHLHPGGRLNTTVYERIGNTYRSVREKEPWCKGARAVTEIAVLTQPGIERGPESDFGATSMLSQLRHQFDLVDRLSDFSPYRVLVLPDAHRLDAGLAAKVERFVAGGGKLILSHESGLDPDGRAFALGGLSLQYEGPWKHEAQYLEALAGFDREIPPMIHEGYEPGSAVKAGGGATVLARVWSGYFDRDFRRFQVEQTPFSGPTGYLAAAQSGNAIYFAIPVFRAYARFAYPVYRQLVANALDRLLPVPLLRAGAPSTAQFSVTAQPGRRVVHALHYIAQRRAPNLDIVEDVIPLANVKLALRSERAPRRVYLAPQRVDLAAKQVSGYAEVTVPAIAGHQMIVFED